MKNWLNRCPGFMNRLWFQLAVSYSLLAFCAMTLLVVMLYGLDDYRDFRKAITLENIEQRIASETLIVSQAINDAQNSKWQKKAQDTIRDKLVNMEQGSGTALYRITSSSRPATYIQITDRSGRVLVSDPASLPEAVAALFHAHQQSASTKIQATHVGDDGRIWVDMPVLGDRGDIIGRLHVFFIAEFDFWIELQSILDFLLHTWISVLLLSVPIGIACGFVASAYVTRQLQKMNEVTESWRQGRFEARIALPGDDVLLRHSRHLNDMAQDLALYLDLRQKIAVSDERTRLARELHDTVKQKLFALGLQLAATKAKPAAMEAAEEHIVEAEAITREAQRDLMEIITQLRPAGTSDTSLYERIQMIADDFRRRFNVTIVFNHAGSSQSSAQIEHHLLRIVQESLMNAVRHGQASEVFISANTDLDTCTLTISDNGSGFDTAHASEGFGITSMLERTQDLPHGQFAIRSSLGAGTEVELSWRNEP